MKEESGPWPPVERSAYEIDNICFKQVRLLSRFLLTQEHAPITAHCLSKRSMDAPRGKKRS